jgi:hypothetical protein
MGQFKVRRLETFGPMFLKLTKHALEQLEGGTVGGAPLFAFDVRTPGAALNVTMQIRQYWRAAQDARREGRLSSIDPLYPLAPLTEKLAVRIVKGTSTVEVIHREQLATHRDLANALGELDKALAGAGANLEPQLPVGEEVEAVARALRGTPGKSAQDSVLEQAYGVAGQGPEPDTAGGKNETK